jgi:serine/threonine-protein kinase
MDAIRWQRTQDLFHEAGKLAPSERRAFLESRCDGDASLVSEVLELLTEDDRTGSPLDRPLGAVAGGILGERAPLAAGVRFGPYRISSLLGEGGMGVVYLGERSDLGTVAAIKVLRDAWLSPARRDRFAAEQRTLARLEHPGIARLYDADALPDGTPWFAMEYVEGTPVTDYCVRLALPLRARLLLFRQICEAVQYAHTNLVVHRDLKPSNVLVRADGSVKLLDFGIAKQLESLEESTDQTRTVARLMTPAYASPEQVLGEPVGVQADVYSLGVILYELLTGRLPHDRGRRTPAEAQAIALQEEPVRPSTVVRRVTGGAEVTGPQETVLALRRSDWGDLDALCLTALQHDRARRYRTVGALSRDVARFLEGRPLEARPDSLGYRARKFLRRRRGVVGLAATAVVLIVGLTGFYTSRLASARNDAVAEAARAGRIQRFTLSLFGGGDEAGPPDSLRVIALIERGLQEASLLDEELEVQTELLSTLGGVFRQLGKLERADSLLQTSLARVSAGPRPDELKRASGLVALGLLRSDQARYDEAEAAIGEALAIAGRRLPPAHPTVLEAREALGHVQVEAGDYDAAIGTMAEMVRLRREADSPPAELAGSIAQLASVHYYAGNLALSDSLNVQALDIYRQLHGERHPDVADMLVNRGAVQLEQGDYRAAEDYYRQALAIARGWYGPEHPEIASIETMVARSLVFQERLDEAAGLLHSALAIRERAYGPMHPEVASTVNELGTIALQRDQYDSAAAAYRRMLDIYRAAYGGKHQRIGIATANLASVYMAQRQNEKAEPLFREAIEMYRGTLGPEHLNVGIARIKLGRTLLRQQRFEEAVRESAEGYRVVSMQAAPTVSWLVAARTDLAAALDTLGRPAQAARFRTEAGALAAAK